MKLTTVQSNSQCCRFRWSKLTDAINLSLYSSICKIIKLLARFNITYLICSAVNRLSKTVYKLEIIVQITFTKSHSHCVSIDERSLQPVGISSIIDRTANSKLASPQNEAIRDLNDFEIPARKFLHSNNVKKSYKLRSHFTRTART